jgi:two-component system sensor histidine kinase PilS (NtrC family)
MLLLWRTMLAIFLTAAGLLLHVLQPGRVPTLGVVAALLPVYLGLALEPAGAWWRLAPTPRRTIQIGLDVLGIGVLCAVTGTTATVVPIFFCVPIVLAATWLGRNAATAVAAWAALCAVVVPLLAGRGGEASELLGAAVHVSVFLAVGLVSGGLAERARLRTQQQLRAELQEQRSQCEVRNIIDQLGSGFLSVDHDGTVTRLNPAGARILGLSPEAVIGRPVIEALGAARAEFAACLTAAQADGQPRKRVEVEIAPAGIVVPVGVSVGFLDSGCGACLGVIAVFSDLTEVRRLREQLRRADRLAGVGELAASIAHEIRNPLASIRGSVEMLAGELELEGHQGQLLQLILKESARVNRIIEDFLHFARVRPPQPRPVALEEFLPDVVLQLNQHVMAHGGEVDVRWSLTPDELDVVADPEQLLQVFLNLAINACEAMHYRGELRLQVAADDDGWCVCEISDSGPGLDLDLSDQIFQPFITTKKQGTGLGLPIVARIVHGHGGTIEAANGARGGAAFTLHLPLGTPREADTDQASRIVLACR